MIDIPIFIILTLVILGMGKTFLGRLVPDVRCSFLEGTIISFGLGAGSLALIVLAVGLAGLLYRWVLITVLSVLLIIVRKNIVATLKDAAAWGTRLRRSGVLPWEWFLIAAIAFVSLFTLIGTLSPVLGMDAAAYHMYCPKIFIQAHQIVPISYTRESLWPFLIQMLFTLGLCLKGVVLAKLFHFAFSLAAVLAIYALCRRYWQRSQAILAATIFALTPAIFTCTTYAYTDLAVVFYTVLAFYGFFVWLDTNNNRWFYLSGIACGFLLGIKITSAIVPGLIFILYMAHVLSKKASWKGGLFSAAIFLLALFAICGIWYLRSWVVLGNPIYPFAAYLFGGNGYPEQILRYHTTSGIGMGVVQFLGMLWPLTFHPDRFGGESMGVIYLLFLPMLVFARKFTKFIRYILVIAFCLYASWFVVYQYTRFLFPALVFLSILAAFIYEECRVQDKWLGKYLSFVILGLFCYSAALSVYHNADKLPVVFGFESEDDYLLKHERTYEIAKYINSNLPKDAKILAMGEARLYYFEREIAPAALIKWELIAQKNEKTGQEFEDYLRAQGLGSYMIYIRDYSKNGCRGTPLTPKNLFTGYNTKLIKQTEFIHRDERYVYELWKINEKFGAAT